MAGRNDCRLAAARKIPVFKMGGSWRFSRTDIDDLFDEQSGIDSPEIVESGNLQKDP